MPLNQGTSDSFGFTNFDTFRTKNYDLPASFTGLKANTTYQIFLNGNDHGWATRQIGKNLGEPLISDQYGRLKIRYLFEITYDGGNYSFQQGSLENQAESFDLSNTKPKNYFISYQFLELKAPGSYFSINVPIRMRLTSEHTNRIENHAD